MPEESPFYKFRWQIASILFGAILVGAGLIISNISFFGGTKVEIIADTSTSPDSTTIIVEISGSVLTPGVYEFNSNDRIQHALDKAGGLAPEANIEYVNKAINKAARLADGQKIYIPSTNEESTLSAISPNAATVNINSASKAELEALWGIGPATAQSLIDSRPYSSVEELLNKKILKTNVYERNKSILSIF